VKSMRRLQSFIQAAVEFKRRGMLERTIARKREARLVEPLVM